MVACGDQRQFCLNTLRFPRRKRWATASLCGSSLFQHRFLSSCPSLCPARHLAAYSPIHLSPYTAPRTALGDSQTPLAGVPDQTSSQIHQVLNDAPQSPALHFLRQRHLLLRRKLLILLQGDLPDQPQDVVSDHQGKGTGMNASTDKKK